MIRRICVHGFGLAAGLVFLTMITFAPFPGARLLNAIALVILTIHMTLVWPHPTAKEKSRRDQTETDGNQAARHPFAPDQSAK